MTPQSAPLPAFNPALRYPVEIALRYLHTSRKTLYAMIARGEVKTIEQGCRMRAGKRIAGRRWIPGSEIERLSRAPS
jgi:hypothetical protein